MVICYIKIAIINILRILLHLFYIFPIKKNRVLFSAYEGRAYGCNPKYIFESLYRKASLEYEFVWCLNNKKELPVEYRGVICVKFMSLLHIYYLLTSKILVSNMGIEPFIPKRNNQKFINTWHGGGAYKRMGFDNSLFTKYESLYMRTTRNLRSKMTDYMIASCRAYIENASVTFNIECDKFLSTGMPRNDVFATSNVYKRECIRKVVCDLYNIDPHSFIILYAPTFRGQWRKQINHDYDIYNDCLLEAIRIRFGKTKCVFLNRLHIAPYEREKSGADRVDIVDVTQYGDMQDLLCASDILITDYSSSIWDYSLAYKPAFLYTPDLETYKEDVNFLTPIELWPYPYAETIASLCKLILNFDEKEAEEKIKQHHELLGSFETGKATDKICDLMKGYLSSNKFS